MKYAMALFAAGLLVAGFGLATGDKVYAVVGLLFAFPALVGVTVKGSE